MEEIRNAAGSLSENSLVEVLGELSARLATGVLRIADGKDIWMSEGRVYLATTESSDQIEVVLFGAGVETEATIIGLLNSETGNAAGVLADRHPDAAPTIDRLLHEHNLSSLFELIVPSDAQYVFEAGVRHPVGDRFAEPAGELIGQAERRLEIWTQIAARIPSTTATFGLTQALPDGDEERIVTGDEWRYLALLDGHNTVADVINLTGESAFRVCSSLYRLLLEGLITER